MSNTLWAILLQAAIFCSLFHKWFSYLAPRILAFTVLVTFRFLILVPGKFTHVYILCFSYLCRKVFCGCDTLSLIIYTKNLLVFVSTFMEYYGHLTYLFIIYHPILCGQFWIFRGTFLRKFNWDKKTTWKKILPQISTNPYTRANLRMCVWPVSKWPIPNYTWRDKNTNFWMSVCACPFYFFFWWPS